MRAPFKNDECWNDPDCLMPIYSRKEVSATRIHVFFLVVLLDDMSALTRDGIECEVGSDDWKYKKND